MAGIPLAGLLGNDTIKSILIWQVLGQLFQPFLAPVVTQLQQDVMGKFPDTALSPQDVVEAVIKNVAQHIDPETEASLSGIDKARLQTLIDAAGEPPGLQTLLEWARREIIPWEGQGAEAVSLEQGVRESRLKDKWNAPIREARTDVLPPAQAVAAALRGNLPRGQAEKRAFEAGVSAEDFGTMVHNAGNPPALGELLELYKRGLIPADGEGPDALSVQQGVYEGDLKNKWYPKVLELGRYIPPPRTVTALLREGSISAETAQQLLQDAGLTPELARDYIAAASKGHASAQKELSKAEVLQLYAEGVIGVQAATADLVKLGLAEVDARELVQLQDVKRDRRLQAQVIARIRTLYVKREVSPQAATEALREVGQDQAEITHLLTLWELERGVPIPHLSGAEIASAVFYQALTVEEGLAGLHALGYSPFEAWLALAVRLHGTTQLPPRPALPAWSG